MTHKQYTFTQKEYTLHTNNTYYTQAMDATNLDL